LLQRMRTTGTACYYLFETDRISFSSHKLLAPICAESGNLHLKVSVVPFQLAFSSVCRYVGAAWCWCWCNCCCRCCLMLLLCCEYCVVALPSTVCC
jgi:hypothetical protein